MHALEGHAYVPFPLALRQARVQTAGRALDAFDRALLTELRDRFDLPAGDRGPLRYYPAGGTALDDHHAIHAWIEMDAGEGERPFVVTFELRAPGERPANGGADVQAVRLPPDHPLFAREAWCAANAAVRALAEKIRARS